MPDPRNYYGFDIEALVNEYGPQFGVKPKAAMRVFQNEGLANYQSNLIEPKTGRREPSFGPFQLYMGGGLGNEFQKATGLDPRNPQTVPRQVQFAMEQASIGGWGPWKGAARAGMSNWEGITPRARNVSSEETFREVPEEETFRELQPAEADIKGRIAAAHETPIMAGKERVTGPEDLAQRMQIVKQQRELGTGAGGAAARGAMAGPFLGWQGEVAGGLNAADQYLQNLIEKGHGGASQAAGQAYTNTVEAERIARQLDEANNPVSRTVAEIGGSVAAPVGPLGRVASAGVAGAKGAALRAAEIAGKGGVIGGIAGAGGAEGGLEDRLRAAQGSALLGAGVGAASRPIAGAFGYVAKPAANTLRGIFAPTSEAERRITSVAAKSPGLTSSEVDAAIAAGKPIVVGDIGGAPLGALARSAKNQSPEAAAALEAAAGDRFITQASRISDEVAALSSTGGRATTTDIRGGIQAAGKAATSPVYDAAYKAGNRGIWSPEIERLTASPAMVAAMKAAVTSGKDRAVAEGFGGFNPGVTIDQADRIVFATGKGGLPTYPNLQYWDYTKRELDRGAKMAARAGDNNGADVLGNLAKQLRTALDKEVPQYAKARSTYATFAGADNAAKAGENFVMQPLNSKTMGEARRAVSQMSLNEREIFKESFIAGLKDKLAAIPESHNVTTQKIFNSKAGREQIEIALGKGGANKLEADIHVEKIMDNLRKAVSGNSTTAQQLLAAGLGEGTGQYFGLDTGIGAAAGILTRAGQRRIDRRVMQRVGETLASGDPETIRRLAQIAAQSPQYMGALRSLSARMAGVTGGENSQVGARFLGGMRGASAEEDQPR